MTGLADGRAVAFFCVADGPGYVPHAITALRSVQRFHPDAGYFVVGAFGYDAGAMRMIARNGLEFQPLDLSEVFSDTVPFRPHNGRAFARVSWPSECFWWVGVPGLMAAKGYRFSCALDGDILAVAPLDLDEAFVGDRPMAAVAKCNGRVNSGVLFFDGDLLRQYDLFAKALEVYRGPVTCSHDRCTSFCRSAGDQRLLDELERSGGLEVRRVDNVYNHILNWEEAAYIERNVDAPFGVDESRILHLLSKPWRPPRRPGRLNPVMCDGYRRWWSFAREVWPDDAERKRFFGTEYPVDERRSLLRPLRR